MLTKHMYLLWIVLVSVSLTGAGRACGGESIASLRRRLEQGAELTWEEHERLRRRDVYEEKLLALELERQERRARVHSLRVSEAAMARQARKQRLAARRAAGYPLYTQGPRVYWSSYYWRPARPSSRSRSRTEYWVPSGVSPGVRR